MGDAPDSPDTPPAELARALGYNFRDPERLARALTHSSLAGALGRDAANQRLEFLGDRVLGLVIAEALLARHPGDDEGAIAHRHSALVRKEALARVARNIGLGEYLRLTGGEEEKGGRGNPSVLADACEAVIGALFADGGLEPARDFILAQWDAMFDEAATPPKDAKTALQEWAQARGLALPDYREVERRGPDHAPIFVVEVHVAGRPPLRAEGASKRAAEQTAAAAMLDKTTSLDDG